MNLSSRASGIVLVAAVLALPFKAGGCGSSACITVTTAQLVNGSCPSRQEAQARFSNQSCPGPTDITSVDSDGTLSGSLCCYSVTSDNSGNSEIECGSTGDVIGEGTSFESSSSGFGGGGIGGGQGCGTCQDALNGAPFTTVCGPAQTTLMSLQVCACNGTCMTSCDPTLCVGNAPDGACLSCLTTNCGAQLTACHQD